MCLSAISHNFLSTFDHNRGGRRKKSRAGKGRALGIRPAHKRRQKRRKNGKVNGRRRRAKRPPGRFAARRQRGRFDAEIVSNSDGQIFLAHCGAFECGGRRFPGGMRVRAPLHFVRGGAGGFVPSHCDACVYVCVCVVVSGVRVSCHCVCVCMLVKYGLGICYALH
jgi:hypothetical protein